MNELTVSTVDLRRTVELLEALVTQVNRRLETTPGNAGSHRVLVGQREDAERLAASYRRQLEA